jgi:hypothetical protein
MLGGVLPSVYEQGHPIREYQLVYEWGAESGFVDEQGSYTSTPYVNHPIHEWGLLTNGVEQLFGIEILEEWCWI